MKTHKITLFLCVAACLFYGCAVLKRGAYTGGGAGAGALIGSTLGPGGTVGGAAVGAVAGQALGENGELRDGGLTGEDAKNKEIERLRRALADRPVVEQPFIPHWIYWAIAAFIAWTKGHHILAFLKGKGFANLFNVGLPSWAQKLTKKAQA